MLTMLTCLLMSCIALKIFRQNNILDVVPIIIICIVVLLVSETFKDITFGKVRKEIELKFSKNDCKDYEVDLMIGSDISLIGYGIVYYTLIAYFVYKLYNIIEYGNNIINMAMPVILLLIFDLVFYFKYCCKQVANKNPKNRFFFFIHLEARFICKGIMAIMCIIGLLMCFPILVLGIVAWVLSWLF